MTENKKEKKILKAVAGSDKTLLKFGGIEIPAYVLENGQRVLSGKGMQDAMGFNKKKSGMALRNFLNTDKLQSFLTTEILAKFDQRIEFKRPGSGGAVSITYGYEATLLIDLCDIIIQAKNTGLLNTENQLNIAKQADIIVRSVAKIGIIALVDEATGYQKQKDEYQKLVAQYIAKELQPYIKTFGEDYYYQIYRLKGWDWSRFTIDKKNHPWAVANYTNRIVYEKLPDGVLDELKKLNPADEKGNRKHKHFQYLSPSIGNNHLLKHLGAIVNIMEGFGNNEWEKALHAIDTRFPSKRVGSQYVLPLDYQSTDKRIFTDTIKKASLPAELNKETKH
jgi:hypothetical protein